MTAEGRGQTAAWPAVDLAAGGGGKGYGKEREKERRAAYEVTLQVEGERLTCAYDQEAPWRQLVKGRSVTVKLDLFGKPDCGDLARVSAAE